MNQEKSSSYADCRQNFRMGSIQVAGTIVCNFIPEFA